MSKSRHGGAQVTPDDNTSVNIATLGGSSLAQHVFGPIGPEEDRPYQYPALSKIDPAQRYEQMSESANLAARLGHSAQANSIQSRLAAFLAKNPNLDTSGIHVQDFGDWRSLAEGTSTEAQGGLVRDFKQRIRRKAINNPDSGINLDRAVNRYKNKLSGQLESSMKQGLIGEIDPSLAAAQTQADSYASQDAIGATEEAAMRSRISSMVRSAESQRMSRIGATLGMGNMANSPAAAALASQAAQEADQMLVGTLRDTGLQVSQANLQQHRQDTELATRIAAQRFALNNGDSKSLMGMQQDIASTLDALYTRGISLDMMDKQIHDAGVQSTGERVRDYLSTGQAAVNLVASAYSGGMLGGGGGGAKSAGGGGTPQGGGPGSNWASGYRPAGY